MDIPKSATQYFKTSGLAKPLSPTARLLLPAPRPTALPGRLPTADCANQPAVDCSPTRHRQDTDETIVLEHYSCVISAIMYSVTCPLALFMK